ncbi:MAG: elongation factor G [Peptococcaceae bacterium]|jgi:elongation factor G|nr:elongation factor G [Peptococcaceae bacterium]
MKAYDSNIIRNIAVLSHDGAGKTALVESMLLMCKGVDAVGRGKDNKHILDFEPEEITRNVTIQLGMAPCEWNGYKLNFIDTPGYSEFCGEISEALRAADGLMLVVSAESGIQVDTIRAWQYGKSLHLPRLIYVNKMDMENADFFGSLERMKELFGKSVMPLQVPIGEGVNFRGIIDVPTQKAYEWVDGERQECDIPAELQDKVAEVLDMCMEAAAEGSDELLEKYLEGEPLSTEEMYEGLYQGMINGRVCPVLCGSAVSHIGSRLLLDCLIKYMPDTTKSINEAVNVDSGEELLVNYDDPFSAFVFKTTLDPFAGKLSYARIISGQATEGMSFYNTTNESEDKISKMFTLIGKQQVPLTSASAGDIIVIPKLDDVRTGDTLASKEFPVKYPAIAFPSSLYTVCVSAENKGDEEKLGAALNKIAEEDPTCVVRKDVESGQLQLSTMGEVHLDHILNKMERKYGAKAILSKVYIPYRETIRGKSTAEGKHKKQSGGHGQYGHVVIDLEPATNGEAFEFVDAIVGGAIPRQFIPAVEKGAVETLAKGVIAGYPLINIKMTLKDGSFHSVDSSEMAFKVAASLALKKGIPEAQPVLLEPIYAVDVMVPEAYMGDIIGDISSKRGRVLGMEPGEDGITTVKARVPYSEMLEYGVQLRAMTQGRGSFDMVFDAYEEVPAKLAENIIADYKAANADA